MLFLAGVIVVVAVAITFSDLIKVTKNSVDPENNPPLTASSNNGCVLPAIAFLLFIAAIMYFGGMLS